MYSFFFFYWQIALQILNGAKLVQEEMISRLQTVLNQPNAGNTFAQKMHIAEMEESAMYSLEIVCVLLDLLEWIVR